MSGIINALLASFILWILILGSLCFWTLGESAFMMGWTLIGIGFLEWRAGNIGLQDEGDSE